MSKAIRDYEVFATRLLRIYKLGMSNLFEFPPAKLIHEAAGIVHYAVGIVHRPGGSICYLGRNLGRD